MTTYTDAYGNVKTWYESPIYSGSTAVQQPSGSYVMVADIIPAHLSSPLSSQSLSEETLIVLPPPTYSSELTIGELQAMGMATPLVSPTGTTQETLVGNLPILSELEKSNLSEEQKQQIYEQAEEGLLTTPALSGILPLAIIGIILLGASK